MEAAQPTLRLTSTGEANPVGRLKPLSCCKYAYPARSPKPTRIVKPAGSEGDLAVASCRHQRSRSGIVTELTIARPPNTPALLAS